MTYFGAGIIALIIGVLTWFTLAEPARQSIGEEDSKDANVKKITIWDVIRDPRVIMLVLAASIRHCGELPTLKQKRKFKECRRVFEADLDCYNVFFSGGMCFAYNCDLYYELYFPDYDLGWWLFAVTIVIGSIGVVAGGVVSDKFVAKMGIRSRVAVLAISQLISTPFAFGSVYFTPTWAMITLGISYFFGMYIATLIFPWTYREI